MKKLYGSAVFTCIGDIKTKNSKNNKDYKLKIRNCFNLQECKRINNYFKIHINVYLKDLESKDVDNITKLILDSLNGVGYKDDRFCMGLEVNKYLTVGDEYFNCIISPVLRGGD